MQQPARKPFNRLSVPAIRTLMTIKRGSVVRFMQDGQQPVVSNIIQTTGTILKNHGQAWGQTRKLEVAKALIELQQAGYVAAHSALMPIETKPLVLMRQKLYGLT